MAYDIHTFGNGEILKGVFDAIAMCLNGHDGTLFEPLKRLGLILGTFWAAIYAIYGNQMKAFTHWIIPMTIIMNLLFVPSTSLWIHDPVTKYHQKVDHVPYGLAAFAGYVSKIGFHLTEQIEKVFSMPDDLRYQKSGSLFASNIIQQAKTFHITNDTLAENMKSFVGQCVMYDAMLGKKYTLHDLRHTDDIWDLVSSRASPVRSFIWRDPNPEGKGREAPVILTCEEGVKRFNRLWEVELGSALSIYGKKIFGKNSLINAKAELGKYLPLSYKALGDMSKSASEILKQNMMIYALVDASEATSQNLGNAPNFATRRAYLQQRSTYETLGAMAGDTLPTMKAVLEAIAYACFLFVIPLALLPFGWRFLLSWGQILLWLQMWAPLYAILNFVMTMAARSKTLSGLSISNDAGVTIASSVGIANMNADIAAMAGYLAMSIPFLCIALVKGVGSFVHLASHLGNVGQGAASTAAGEVTSGNFNYGNISEGNSQISNSSMLSQSVAASYKSGAFQFSDGRMDMASMPDGSQVMNIGNSNLPISINAAESLSAQQSEMATRAYQQGLNLSESSSQNLSSASRSAVQLSQALGRMESAGDSSSLGISTEQSQSIHKGANLVSDFAHQNNVSTDKAASILGEASAGLGLGKNSLSISGKGSLSAQDQELYQKAQKFAEDHNFQQAMREASQASKQLSHNLSDESSRRLAEDVSGSYEKGISQRNEASKSFSQSDSYSTQASLTRANSATINRNASQEFVDWMAEQPADNSPGRLGHRGAGYIIANQQEQATAYAQKFMAEKGLTASQGLGMNPSQLRNHYDQQSAHHIHSVSTRDLDDVRSQGSDFSANANKALTRDDVETMQSDHRHAIESSSHNLMGEGNSVKQHHTYEQSKGVIRHLGERGISEVGEIVDDVKNMWPGEAQQK